MSASENESSYFIRVRGKVLGPFSLKQLNTLRARGQFSQSNEVSIDGTTWESASALNALFSGGKRSQSKADDLLTEAIAEMPAGRTRDEWHYSFNGEQQGPVSLAKISSLLEAGQLSRRDLVWTEGMSEWQSIADTPELQSAAAPRRAVRQRRSRSSQTTVVDPKEGEHFLDHAIRFLREVFGEDLVTSIGSSSIQTGRYAIYLAVFLSLIFYLSVAVKASSARLLLPGVSFAVLVIVCQFSAVKSCAAINQAIRNKVLRISSGAFFDSVLLIVAFLGINSLLAGIAIGIELKQSLPVLYGVGLFIACEQFALTLLHPSVIGITVSSRATAGEDALTILAFFLLLPLRFVSAVLLLGTSAGCFGFGYATYLAAMAKPDHLLYFSPIEIGMTSCSVTLISAIFPFLAYIYFVFQSLILDFIRSVLIVPEKLDLLTAEVANGQIKSTDDSLAFDAN